MFLILNMPRARSHGCAPRACSIVHMELYKDKYNTGRFRRLTTNFSLGGQIKNLPRYKTPRSLCGRVTDFLQLIELCQSFLRIYPTYY